MACLRSDSARQVAAAVCSGTPAKSAIRGYYERRLHPHPAPGKVAGITAKCCLEMTRCWGVLVELTGDFGRLELLIEVESCLTVIDGVFVKLTVVFAYVTYKLTMKFHVSILRM